MFLCVYVLQNFRLYSLICVETAFFVGKDPRATCFQPQDGIETLTRKI